MEEPYRNIHTHTHICKTYTHTDPNIEPINIQFMYTCKAAPQGSNEVDHLEFLVFVYLCLHNISCAVKTHCTQAHTAMPSHTDTPTYMCGPVIKTDRNDKHRHRQIAVSRCDSRGTVSTLRMRHRS